MMQFCSLYPKYILSKNAKAIVSAKNNPTGVYLLPYIYTDQATVVSRTQLVYCLITKFMM